MKLPNYDDSILAITSSILKNYGIDSPYPSMKDVDQELSKKYKNVFLWIIDGLGHYNLESLYEPSDGIRKWEVRLISSIYPSSIPSDFFPSSSVHRSSVPGGPFLFSD